MATSTTLSPFTVAADNYSFTESSFLASTDLVAPTIIQLNVTANDSVGKNAQVWSVDDGTNSATDLLTTDLKNGQVSLWTQDLLSAQGNELRIVNGKVQLDIAHSLSVLGLSDVSQLTSGQVITDSFTYAVKNATTGAIAWTTVTFSLSGEGVAVNTQAHITGALTGKVVEDQQLTTGGVISANDPDPGQNGFQAVAPTALQGQYGVFTFSPTTGTWGYTLNASLPGVQALSGNWFDGSTQHGADSLDDSLTVSSLDGTDTQTLHVTVTGSNDTATITGQDAFSYTEGVVTSPTLNHLTVADKDAGQSALRVPAGAVQAVDTTGQPVPGWYQVALPHGLLVVNPTSGDWSFQPDQAQLDSLRGGLTVDDTFTLTSLDGSATRTLTFHFTGVNDGASIHGDQAASLSATATGVVTGALAVLDPDAGEAGFARPANATALPDGSYRVDTAYGHFVFTPSAGTPSQAGWTFTLDTASDATRALPDGVAGQAVLTLQSLDGSATESVTITIIGVNDTAVIGGTDSLILDENDTGGAPAGYAVVVNDADTGQAAFASMDPVYLQGQYGVFTFVPDPDGGNTATWNYTLTAPLEVLAGALDGAPPDSVSDSVRIDSFDGTASRVLHVSIVGSNDNAHIGSAGTAGAVTEDGGLVAQGQLTVTDLDAGQNHFRAPTSLQGQYGLFTFDTDNGKWTYTLDNSNADVQALNPDQTLADSLSVTSADHQASTTIEVTIQGTLDRLPPQTLDFGAVTEDAWLQPAALPLPKFFVPADGPSILQTDYGSFHVVADPHGGPGYLAYFELDNDAAQPLSAGSTPIPLSVTVLDALGSTVTLTAQVHGANDVPTLTGPTAFLIDENDLNPVQGAFTISDADLGQSAFGTTSSLHGQYGDFTFTPGGLDDEGRGTATVTYTLRAPLDALSGGLGGAAPEEVTDTLTVNSADGLGQRTLVVTLRGSNDPAHIDGPASLAYVEDSSATLAVNTLSVTDPDAGQAALSVPANAQPYLVDGEPQPGMFLVQGTYGQFLLVPATGAWSYIPDETRLDPLHAGATDTDSLTLTSLDGTASQTVTVDVTGSDDDAAITVQRLNGTELTAGEDRQLFGRMFVQDRDAGQSTFQAPEGGVYLGHDVWNVSTPYGYFLFKPDAATPSQAIWTFVPLPDSEATQALGEGVQDEAVLRVLSQDGTAIGSVRVVLTGVNDLAHISGIGSSTIDENDSTPLQFDLSVSDADTGQSDFIAPSADDLAGQYGHFTFTPGAPDAQGHATATVTYTRTAPLDALAGPLDGQPADSVYDQLAITSADGKTQQFIQVFIQGSNDAPTLDGERTGEVTEDGTGVASGDLTIDDPDNGQNYFRVPAGTALAGTYGQFTFDAAGHWTYTLDNSNPDVQALGAADPALQDQLVVTSGDGSRSTTITVAIHGADDTPTPLTLDLGEVLEDVSVGTEGQFLPPGFGPDGVADLATPYGSFILKPPGSPEGSYAAAFLLDNDAAQGLGADATVPLSVTLHDASGAEVTLTVDVKGSNDPATMQAFVNDVVVEDDVIIAARSDAGAPTGGDLTPGTVVGDLFVSDADDGESVLQVPEGAVPLHLGGGKDGGSTTYRLEMSYGTLLLNPSSGHWTYQQDPAKVAPLQPGEERAETVVTLVSADGTASRELHITVVGVDDPAQFSGALGGSYTEGAGPAHRPSGQILAIDPDAPAAPSVLVLPDDAVAILKPDGTPTGIYALAMDYGTLRINPTTGAWSYLPREPLLDPLAEGQPAQDSVTLYALDATHQTQTPLTFTIALTGADDPASFSGTFSLLVDANNGTPVSADVTVIDPDAGEAQFAEASFDFPSQYGSFHFTSVGDQGTWTYTLDTLNADVRALQSAQTLTDTFNLGSLHGDAAQLTVTIAGVSKPPQVLSLGTVAEDIALTSTLQPLPDGYTLPEGTTLPLRVTGANGYGQFEVFLYDDPRSGTSFPVARYLVDNDSDAVQGLVSRQIVHDSYDLTTADGRVLHLTVDLGGQDDPASITGPLEVLALPEDTAEGLMAGSLALVDRDAGQAYMVLESANTAYTPKGGDPISLGVFQFNGSTGAWSYNLGHDGQALAQGETALQTMTVVSADGSAHFTVQVEVQGADDNATAITGDLARDLTEDSGDYRTGGRVLVLDPDVSQRQFQPLAGGDPGGKGGSGPTHGTYGDFTFDSATGDWTYTLRNDDPAVQGLRSDQAYADTLTVTSLDGTVTQEIRVTVHGVSEPATIAGKLTGSVTEDDVTTVKGLVEVVPGDDPAPALQAIVVPVQGTYGSFKMNAAGQWSYGLYTSGEGGDRVNALAGNETQRETFTVSTAGENPVTQTVTIEVHGKNDVPSFTVVEGGNPGEVLEDGGSLQTATGVIRITDPDANQSFPATAFNQPIATPYGSYILTPESEDGSLVRWTYTLDNANPEVQALRSGDEPLVDTVSLTPADGSAPFELSLLVVGQDDMPSLVGRTAFTILEDSASHQISGHLDLLDPEGRLAGEPVADGASHGTLTLVADPAGGWNWIYQLNEGDPAVNALTGATGETPLLDTLTLTDGQGVQLGQLAITIQGHDDPTVAQDVTVVTDEDSLGGFVQEGATPPAPEGGELPRDGFLANHKGGDWVPTTFSGQIAYTDPDSPAPFTPIGADDPAGLGSNGYGHFTLTADGQWTWEALRPHEEFNGGQRYTDSLIVQTVSGQAVTLTVQIDGIDDPTEIGGEYVPLTQGSSVADLSASGTLPIEDYDAASPLEVQTEVEGQYGRFSIDTTGHWSFAAYDAMTWLAGGEGVEESFYIYVDDAEHDYGVITVALQGSDDPTQVFSVDRTTAVEGDAATDIQASGLLGWSDPDNGSIAIPSHDANPGAGIEDHFHEPLTFVAQTQTGLYGSLTLETDGHWNYVGNGAHDELAGGTDYTDHFTVTLSNGATGSLDVLITGTDDLPQLPADRVFGLSETEADHDLVISLASLIEDPDGGPALSFQTTTTGAAGYLMVDSGGQSFISPAQPWGSFSVQGDSLVYTPDLSQHNPSETEHLVDSITLHTNDGRSIEVQVVVDGVDDPTQLNPTNTATVEGGQASYETLGGNVLRMPDPDSDEPILERNGIVGDYGLFSVSVEGVWSYQPDATKIAALADGASATDPFVVVAADGKSSTRVVITVHGVDDPLTSWQAGSLASVTEGDTAQDLHASGQLTFTDPDTANPFVASTQRGDYGTFTLTTDGHWTFSADGPHDELSANDTVVDVFRVTLQPGLVVADDVTLSSKVFIEINGTDEAPREGTNVVDDLRGTAGADTLYGGGGDDSLNGGAGNDRLEGGAGRDSLSGGLGDDVMIGTGTRLLVGGATPTPAETAAAYAAGDLFYGGEGHDVMDGSQSTGQNLFDTRNALPGMNDSTQILFGTGQNIATLGVGQDVLWINPATTAGTYNAASDFDVDNDRIMVDTSAFPLAQDGSPGGTLSMVQVETSLFLHYQDQAAGVDMNLLELTGWIYSPQDYDYIANNVILTDSWGGVGQQK